MNIVNIETIIRDLKILINRVEFIDKVIDDNRLITADLKVKYNDEDDFFVDGEITLRHDVVFGALLEQKEILLGKIEELKAELIKMCK